MIRSYQDADLSAIKRLFAANSLPPACLPDLSNPLFFVRLVNDKAGRITQAGFIKIIGEAYVLIDHEAETPEQRWTDLQTLTAHTLAAASDMGLSEVSCWVPPAVEPSFGKRLVDLGFKKSPWPSYSVLL